MIFSSPWKFGESFLCLSFSSTFSAHFQHSFRVERWMMWLPDSISLTDWPTTKIKHGESVNLFWDGISWSTSTLRVSRSSKKRFIFWAAQKWGFWTYFVVNEINFCKDYFSFDFRFAFSRPIISVIIASAGQKAILQPSRHVKQQQRKGLNFSLDR